MAKLYTGLHYQGQVVQIGEGNINNLGNGADIRIVSIMLEPGYQITVFDEQKGRGVQRTFTLRYQSSYLWMG